VTSARPQVLRLAGGQRLPAGAWWPVAVVLP